MVDYLFGFIATKNTDINVANNYIDNNKLIQDYNRNMELNTKIDELNKKLELHCQKQDVHQAHHRL